MSLARTDLLKRNVEHIVVSCLHFSEEQNPFSCYRLSIHPPGFVPFIDKNLKLLDGCSIDLNRVLNRFARLNGRKKSNDDKTLRKYRYRHGANLQDSIKCLGTHILFNCIPHTTSATAMHTNKKKTL